MRWRPDPEALALLDREGGPFESSAYRAALTATLPDMTDMSWGGSGPGGVTAAVALVGSVPLADCVPIDGYGAIRSTRPLTAAEANAFLTTARRHARARRLWFRSVALDDRDWSFASVIGTASVVPVDGEAEPETRYSRLTRRSLGRARAAGCTVAVTHDPEPFLRLYAAASADWDKHYPEALIRALAAAEVARFDDVVRDGDVVASMLTVLGRDHWMCWLAAQSDAGREVAASYLAYDSVFREARGAVPCVNLGASAPGTGGGEFKRRLGADERPIYQWDTANLVARVNDARVRMLRR
jgi:hypothetical protein